MTMVTLAMAAAVPRNMVTAARMTEKPASERRSTERERRSARVFWVFS
jgi:hypothetical protein